MKNSKNIVENAIQKAQSEGIRITYKPINDNYFDLTITVSYDSHNCNHIYAHVPYATLNNVTEEKLLKRLHELAEQKLID